MKISILLLEIYPELVYNTKVSDIKWVNLIEKSKNKTSWRKIVKRKFAALLMVLMVCMSIFTGCSLVTRNDQKYFEATVATITYTTGEKEKITKRELITAYNSYGYNYVDNYGYSKKEAIEQTLETIVDKKLTIKAVENYYKADVSRGEMLNGNETTYLWDSTYEALYSNFKSYLKEVLDIDDDSNDETSTDTDASVYTEYKSSVYLEKVSGKYVIKTNTPATTTRETYKGRKNDNDVYVNYEYKDSEGKEVFKEQMYSKLYALTNADESLSTKNWKSAFNNYISDIKENYSYKTFASDKACFMFEMDRVYNIIKDNYLVEKYSTIYNIQEHQDVDITNVTVKDVLEYYSAKVRADYTKYVIQNNKDSFESSILSNVGDVDYILDGNGSSDYFYVASIKLELTETQKTKLEELDSKLATNSIGYEEYKIEVDKVYNSISATIRNAETGEKTSNTISAQNLLNQINDEMSGYKYLTVEELTSEQRAEATAEGKTFEQYVADYNTYTVDYNKADAFRKYLYLYNDDDSLKGADYNTVFGVNSSREVLAPESFSDNEDIKQAILGLFNDDQAQIGDTTDFVRTDDGVYMFFYAGRIENLFDGIDENFNLTVEESIKVLTKTRLNIFSNKTVFDTIYSQLTKDNFSVFENMNMNYLRTSLTTKIESIDNNLKDLY